MTGEDMDAQKLRLSRVLGTTFGLATQVEGDYELPADFEDKWFEAMTIDPTRHIGNGPFIDPQTGQNVELATLMSMGQWNPSFMANITTRMIDFERTEVPDGDWSRWGGSAWVTTPTNQTGDPVAQLMEALSNNRAASQMVFSGGTQKELTVSGQKVQVNDYLHYILTQRQTRVPGDEEKIGRALALAMAEVPGEFTTDPIRLDIENIVTWGEQETARLKEEQEKNDKPWYVDLGHFLLDLGGLIPGLGEGFDLANAAWYGAEGRYDMSALSAASAVPGLGYAAVGTKWSKSGMKAAEALELAAKIDKAAAGVPTTVKVSKGLDGTFQPMLKLEIDNAADLAAVLKNPPPNTTFVYKGKKFHTDVTGAVVVTGGGGMRKFMEVSKLPDPGSRLVYQRYPGAPKHEFVVGSNGELVLQKKLKDLDNLERGQAFNAQNWKRFEHNEIYVKGPGGKGFVDSYVPGKFIIERKATYYGDLKNPMSKMKKDVDELTVQYKLARVPDTPGNLDNHGALVGQRLKGQPVLEIPPQNLTDDLIKYAEKKRVTIVDPTGKVYTPNRPLRSKYP